MLYGCSDESRLLYLHRTALNKCEFHSSKGLDRTNDQFTPFMLHLNFQEMCIGHSNSLQSFEMLDTLTTL